MSNEPTIEAANISCIYIIINTHTNHSYIGATRNYKKRVKRHKELLKSGKHHSRKFQIAYNEYGESAFSFVILERVSIANLPSKELEYIQRLSPEYNLNLSSSTILGNKRTAEFCEKISNKLLGKTPPNKGKRLSAEKKEAIRKSRTENDNYFKGREITEVEKQNLRQLKGYPVIASMLTGEIIGVYGSINEAAKKTQRSNGGVYNVCTGKRPHCNGVIYKYLTSQQQSNEQSK